MALGILGGVALMGFISSRILLSPTQSMNLTHQYLMTQVYLPFFFPPLNYSSTQLDRCIVFPLCSGDRKDAALLCVSI